MVYLKRGKPVFIIYAEKLCKFVFEPPKLDKSVVSTSWVLSIAALGADITKWDFLGHK